MEEAITHTNASRIRIAAVMDSFPCAGQNDEFFGRMHGLGSVAVQSFTCSKVVITRWYARARKPKET
jgi:hypothetical protein